MKVSCLALCKTAKQTGCRSGSNGWKGDIPSSGPKPKSLLLARQDIGRRFTFTIAVEYRTTDLAELIAYDILLEGRAAHRCPTASVTLITCNNGMLKAAIREQGLKGPTLTSRIGGGTHGTV